MAIDSGLLAQDALASPAERIKALRPLLDGDGSMPAQAALDDSHANLNILATILTGESSRGVALQLRTDVETALRAVATGGTVDWTELRLRLGELEQAFSRPS